MLWASFLKLLNNFQSYIFHHGYYLLNFETDADGINTVMISTKHMQLYNETYGPQSLLRS